MPDKEGLLADRPASYALQLEALDPQLVMEFGGPPPPRQPVPKMDPAELLEHFKPQIMQTLGFEGDEDMWEEVAEGQAEMAIAMRDRDDQVKSRDIWVRDLLTFLHMSACLSFCSACRPREIYTTGLVESCKALNSCLTQQLASVVGRSPSLSGCASLQILRKHPQSLR